MVIKCSDYAGSKEPSLKTMKSKGPSCISELSSMNGVPVVILLTWYKRHIEELNEIESRLEKIIDFYEYSEIVED